MFGYQEINQWDCKGVGWKMKNQRKRLKRGGAWESKPGRSDHWKSRINLETLIVQLVEYANRPWIETLNLDLEIDDNLEENRSTDTALTKTSEFLIWSGLRSVKYKNGHVTDPVFGFFSKNPANRHPLVTGFEIRYFLRQALVRRIEIFVNDSTVEIMRIFFFHSFAFKHSSPKIGVTTLN